MIDVIVPNYNGQRFLAACFTALRHQTRHHDVRVTMVDDASSDDSVAFVRANFPEVQVIVMPRNGGFVNACNTGVAATDGEFVVLLNNDTEADPGWLAELIGTLETNPAYAFAASKLMLFDDRSKIHAAGDFYRVDGIPGNRGVWQPDAPTFQHDQEVWGACAGAAAYRRSVLETLLSDGGMFDRDLTMYCEDVDFNFRARLHGHRTIYVARAIVYHHVSATGGGVLASYYCGRNFILVWLKNMPRALVWRYGWRFVRSQLHITWSAVRHIRGQAARARLRGQLRALWDAPRFLQKRSAIPLHVDERLLHLTGDESHGAS